MNSKSKVEDKNFEWTASELKKSKRISDLPKSLQAKLASRKTKGYVIYA